MKKRWMKVLGILMAGTMAMGSLTACGGDKKADSDAAGSDVSIAVICSSAGQNDNGYNQSAVDGAKKAAEELGVEYKVVAVHQRSSSGVGVSGGGWLRCDLQSGI